MIKEALEFLTKLQTPKNPVIETVHGQPYIVKADGTLGERVTPVGRLWPRPPIGLATLTGLAEVCKQKPNLDNVRVALQVNNYRSVSLVDFDLDDFGVRRVYATANHSGETIGERFERDRAALEALVMRMV